MYIMTALVAGKRQYGVRSSLVPYFYVNYDLVVGEVSTPTLSLYLHR
jgi:hypothetical protein